MKTYKTTIEKPRLEISYDMFADNPRREDTTLGYFFMFDSKFISPNAKEKNPELYSIIQSQSELAIDLDDHIKRIKEYAKLAGIEILYITPIVKHEHGNASFSRGHVKGFDYSNNSFYIVTPETASEMYTDKDTQTIEEYERIIDSELKLYTDWANGEVFTITLYDEDGEIQEQVGQIYGDIDDIKQSLPAEFKDENMQDYFVR